MRVLRGVVYMMKSRAPRTEPWRTPQEEVHKDEKVPSVQNGRTNRDAVWVEDSGGPKEIHIRWGFRSPMGRGNYKGERGGPL